MSEAPSAERATRSTSPFINAMSPEDRRAHMRAIGARGNAGRLTLCADEAEALAQAYALIDKIYRRHQAKLAASIDGETSDG